MASPEAAVGCTDRCRLTSQRTAGRHLAVILVVAESSDALRRSVRMFDLRVSASLLKRSPGVYLVRLACLGGCPYPVCRAGDRPGGGRSRAEDARYRPAWARVTSNHDRSRRNWRHESRSRALEAWRALPKTTLIPVPDAHVGMCAGRSAGPFHEPQRHLANLVSPRCLQLVHPRRTKHLELLRIAFGRLA